MKCRRYLEKLLFQRTDLPFSLQIKHAIRTYKNAISVYKETTWSHIKDHVHFNIGQ